MKQRKADGYTLIEMMIAISLLAVVAGMLYAYNNKGWSLFSKGLSYGHLQVDSRAALNQLAQNIKRSSSDLIYTSLVLIPMCHNLRI